MIINGKEYYYRLDGQEFHCALDITMRYLGGKWKSVILWYLRGGQLRFAELRRAIPEITETMLSRQLKELVHDDLIERLVLPTTPVGVAYKVTKHGKTILPVVEKMAEWGRKLGQRDGEMLEIPTVAGQKAIRKSKSR